MWIPKPPDQIVRRVCAYLFDNYLGRFCEEKVRSDQFSVDWRNGIGTVSDVWLDTESLNELGDQHNFPFEVLDGHIDKVTVSVPYMSLLKDASRVEIDGVRLTIQPKQRIESATSMFESMFSMTSSMQMAEECLKQTEISDFDRGAPNIIESFAKTIDSILSKVKVKLVNTVIQVEYVPKDSITGIGLQIRVDLLEYLDESGDDPSTTDDAAKNTLHEKSKTYLSSSFTTKNISLVGVSFHTMEFLAKNRTVSRSLYKSNLTDEPVENRIINMSGESSRSESNENDDSSDEKFYDADDHKQIIKWGILVGQQQLILRIRRNDKPSDSNVMVELNLGAFVTFLAPRQVHLLLELLEGLSQPGTVDTRNVKSKHQCVEKPMTGQDYQRIQQELQYQYENVNYIRDFTSIRGWSTPLDTEEDFLPLKSPNRLSSLTGSTSTLFKPDLADSTLMETSLTSSTTSFASESVPRSRRRVSAIDTDPTADISHFQIRMPSVCLILLHDDLLVLDTESPHVLATSSVQQMQRTADSFFVKLLSIDGHNGMDLNSLREIYRDICDLSHLRLLISNIQVDAKETSTDSAFSISSNVIAACSELVECLYYDKISPPDYTSLLTFSNTVLGDASIHRPNINISFKHISKTARTGRHSNHDTTLKTDVGITLDTCHLDLDISIVDRLSALLDVAPICIIARSGHNFSPAAHKSGDESKLDFKIRSPSVTIKLRFPVPDFRPQHDLQRTPFWKKHVRSDYLSLQLTDMTLQTTLRSEQLSQKFTIECRTADVMYYESDNHASLPILRAGVDKQLDTSITDVFNWLRIVFEIHPTTKTEIDLEQGSVEPEVESMTQSVYGNFPSSHTKQKDPFSVDNVIHERAHNGDPVQFILPGNRKEMSDFIEFSTRDVRLNLDISLPIVSVQMVDKHIYEVLYNRINTDLLLWKSSAPKRKSLNVASVINETFMSMQNEGAGYKMCTSGTQHKFDFESEEPKDSYIPSMYQSFYKSNEDISIMAANDPKRQSHFAMNLHVGRGILSMNTKFRNSSLEVVPNHQGEFIFSVDDAKLFTVSGYCGDEALNYVCLQIHNVDMHHCEMMPTPSQSPPLFDIDSVLPRHLHPVIHKSECGTLQMAQERGGDRDMFTVAIKIEANHETHHVKTVSVAVGINKATMRHHMCLEPNSWISQLINFFDVDDYSIPGYQARDVMTQIHLHLWDCAIDYRPLHLPLRSVVTLGSLSMSSTMTALSNSVILYFLLEESMLFISDKSPPRNGTPSLAPVDLKKDYVSVVELSLFELTLKIKDKAGGTDPLSDLQASINMVHIRTCADSAHALMQLITYFASDGDLASTEPHFIPTGSNFSSPYHQSDQELVSVDPQDISQLSKSQHQKVNQMLSEAMQESLIIKETAKYVPSDGTKIFYFPDEKSPCDRNNSKPISQVTNDLGNFTYVSCKGYDTDDEFYIVGNEAGLGVPSKDGFPEIRWLSDDPVRVIDDYFSTPEAKTDLLKSPKHYPIPITSVALCELTLVWHMYGGSDFKVYQDSKNKKVTFSESQLSPNVNFSNARGGEVVLSAAVPKKKKIDWQERGGSNRDHSVLMEVQLSKVRFQHDLYPDSAPQASRQVVLITEFEIRDRLETSQYNKFLHHYTCEKKPKQSQAHMLFVKLLHVRPDPKLKSTECNLKISMLPLKFNIDQDSMLFLYKFFIDISDMSDQEGEAASSSKHNTPTHKPPILTVASTSEEVLEKEAEAIVENLLLLSDEETAAEDDVEPVKSKSPDTGDTDPVYFRSVCFEPEVTIRIDYHGKRFVKSHGSLAGILMCLAQLNSAELKLKRLRTRNGLLGFEKVLMFLVHEWKTDILKNQLQGILGGVGPMHTFLQIIQGIVDLFWLPIEQYQKDGRIVRGLQRGANSFTTSTLMAALELASKFINLFLLTAETACDFISPGPSIKKIRHSQPQDIREGLTTACKLVKEGFGETADNLVRVAKHEHEQKGYSGAVGGVIRQLPQTIIVPIIKMSEATNNVLGGVRSQLVPDVRREASEKWREASEKWRSDEK